MLEKINKPLANQTLINFNSRGKSFKFSFSDQNVVNPNIKNQCLFAQILITVILLIMAVLISEFTNFDEFIQNFFYNTESKAWILSRNNPVLKFIFYDGIKKLLIFVLASILVTLVILRKKSLIKNYRKGLIIVLLAGILIPTIVGGLKFTTNTPCPKNIINYNEPVANLTS